MNDLIRLATAALKYDAAIQACANDPDKMASHCTAEGDDLDTLYADWVSLARAAMADDELHSRTNPDEPATDSSILSADARQADMLAMDDGRVIGGQNRTSGKDGATPKDSADPQGSDTGAFAAELRMLARSAINDDLPLTQPMTPERNRHVHRYEALVTAARMIDRLALQVQQADERGDEAMRRAHAAEAALAAPAEPVRAALAELVAVSDLRRRMGSLHEGKLDEVRALAAEYARRQPLAWEAARAALATVDESAKSPVDETAETQSREPAVSITVFTPDGAEVASWQRDAQGRLVDSEGGEP